MITIGGRWPTAEVLRQLIGGYGNDHPDNKLFVNYGPTRPEDTAARARSSRVLNASVLPKYDQGRKIYAVGCGLPVSQNPQDLISAGYYMLLERRPEHRGGADIRVYSAREGELSDRYFVPYVHADKEIRVWTMLGEVFAIYKKKLATGTQPTGYPFVKSHRNGWVFELVSKPNWTREFGGSLQKIRMLAKQTMNATRLDFGALDIGVGVVAPTALREQLIDPDLIAFEANAAPGVTTERSVGLRKLAKRIKAFHDSYFGFSSGYPYGTDTANTNLDSEDSESIDDER
jgi:hypothetical protein